MKENQCLMMLISVSYSLSFETYINICNDDSGKVFRPVVIVCH